MNAPAKKKSGTITAALATAAGKQQPQPVEATAANKKDIVPVAAHYPPEVRRALKMLEAETGKKLKQLLGEAINDLCHKYNKPQPYREEA
ncbi:ribbon-helix-helix domain-containing protein [Methylovulum psychrotolerans]|uniref:Antitoxin-like ribbon-helix-helix domain-containing protein n=1 Tax=Methylovulum psychrotolerans TaxID=1704499 RepID=A0A2S5CFV1_9GAMM|nr:ribbon-helix-helix domain-containing protein [Methylovulum psychrotolerans]POZ49684.1 hypothetical protein AADEFJLK_04550 [Methylovulum psychrotolerans]